MARKKLTDKNEFDDLEFNFDQQSDDLADEFLFDFGADTDSSKNRSPVEKIRRGASSTLSGMTKSFIPGMKDRINEKMPDAGKFISEVGGFTSDMKYLTTEFQRELAPSIVQLKRAGRIVGNKIKFFLPKGLQDKYDQVMSEEESQAKIASVSKDQAEDMNISSSIDNIFSKNTSLQMQVQQAQFEDEKSDKLIDRNLAGQRHSQSFQQLQAINVATTFHQRFTENIHIPYLKKDLEIKFRHYYAARDTLTQVKGLTKILDDKLDQIRHNTALPDFAKLRTWEAMKENARDRFVGKVSGYAQSGLQAVGTRLKERVLEPLKDMIEMAATGADVYADIEEGNAEMGIPKKGIAEEAGGFAGSFLGKKMAKALSSKMFGSDKTLAKLMYQWNDKFKNAIPSAQAKAKAYAEDNDGMLAVLASVFGGDGGSAKALNTIHLKNPDEAGTLTNQAVLSITTIMPGYLAKMTKHLETLVTGKPADELIYDTKSNTFITSTLYKQQFVQEAVGDRRARSSRLGKMSGTIKGMYDDKVTNYDEIESDMLVFLNNLVINGRELEPKYIANYTGNLIKRSGDTLEGSEWEDNLDSNTSRWAKWAFKGVKDPDKLAKALESIIFRNGNTKNVNTAAVRNINNLVMADQSFNSFQKVMQKAIAQGNAGHLGDYIKRGGGTFALDDDRIAKDLLINDDASAFGSSKEYSEKYSKEHMTKMSEDIWNDLKNDPNWNKSIVKKVLDVSAKAKQKWYARSDAKEFDSFYWDGSEDGEIVSKGMLDKLKEVAPWAFVAIDKAQTSIKDGAKSGAAKFLAADKRRRSKLEEEDDLDPYVQRRLEMLQDSGALGSIPGPMLANILKTPKKKRVQSSKSTKDIFKDTTMDVKVINFKDIAEIMKGTIPSTAVTADKVNIQSEGSGSVVNAITRFEETFKKYANKSDINFKEYTSSFKDYFNSSLEYLKNLPPININTVAMTSQFDKILGATKSTAQGLWSGIGSGFNALGKGLGTGTKMFYDAAGKALQPLGAGIGGGLKGIGTGIGGLLTGAGSVLSTTATFSADTMRGIGTTIKGVGSTIGGGIKKKKFVDIFRKGEVDPGKPLVTALDQINGKIIDSKTQEPISSSYSITNALMKVTPGDSTPMIVITEEDIEHGLVDINGSDLKGGVFRKGGRLLGKGLMKPFSMLGDLFKSDNPVMKAYGAILGMGVDFAKSVGGGIKAFGKRMFGLDGLPKDAVSKQSLEEIVGKRLDTMIGLLKSGSGDAKPGDEDGDGKRDTIFEEREREEKEEQEAIDRKKQNKFYDNFSKMSIGREKAKPKSMLDNILGFVKNPIVIMGAIAAAITGIQKIFTTVSEKMDSAGGLLSFLPGIAELLGWEGAMTIAGSMVAGLGYTATKSWVKRKIGGPKYYPGVPPGATPPKKPGLLSRAWNKTKDMFGPTSKATTKVGAYAMATKPQQGWFARMVSKLPLPGVWGKAIKVAVGGTVLVGGTTMAVGALSPDEAMAYASKPILDPNTGTPVINPDTGEPITVGDMASPAEIQAQIEKEKAKPDHTKYDESKKTAYEKSAWETMKGYGTSIGEFTGITDAWKNKQNAYKQAWDGVKNADGFFDTAWAGVKGLGNMVKSDIEFTATAAAGLLVGKTGAVVLGTGAVIKSVDDILLDRALQRAILPHIGIQTDDFLERRCKWYGVHGGVNWSVSDAWKRLTGNSEYQLILELEDLTYEILKDKKTFTQSIAREWTDSFGFKDNNNLDVGFWITWYKFKFVPILRELSIGLQKVGVPFKDRYKLTNAQKNVVMAHVSTACAKEMGPTTAHLNPTQSNLEAYKKKLNNKDPGKRISYLKGLTEDTNKVLSDTKDKVKPDTKDDNKPAQAAYKYMFNIHGMPMHMNIPTSNNTSSNTNNVNTSSSSGTSPSGAPSNFLAGGSSNYSPNIPQARPTQASSAGSGVAIGSHMKKFESGTKGSAAIGYDVPGGTSYGTFQIISKRGRYGSTMDTFINFCKTAAPEVYKALHPIKDQMNTLGKTGKAVEVWQELVNKGHITYELERKFFVQHFWKPGLNMLKKGNNGQQLHDFLMSDRALQEFTWSTFVALGLGGTRSLFSKVYKPGMTPEQFLDSAGAIRYSGSTYASFIKNHPGGAAAVARRGRNEIALLKSLIGQPPMNIDGSVPTGGSTAGGGVQSFSGNKVHPMPGYNGRKSVVTSPYGKKRGNRRHSGIDLDVPGTDIRDGIVPVYAYMDGTVTRAGWSDDYGNVVYIQHADGNKSIYGHLDSISPSIKTGMKVGAGTEVGRMGNTGKSRGTHLHFELTKANNHYSKIDSNFAATLPSGISGGSTEKPVEKATTANVLTPAGTNITPPGRKSTIPQAKPVPDKSVPDPKKPMGRDFLLGQSNKTPGQDIITAAGTTNAIGGPDLPTTKEDGKTTLVFDKEFKQFAELAIMLLQQLVASNQEIPLAFSKAYANMTNTSPKVHPNAGPQPRQFDGTFTGVKAA